MRISARLLLAASLAAAFTGAGCGKPRGDAEEEAAKDGARHTLEVYMQAMKDGDCKTAYSCLSWRRRREISLKEIEADYAQHHDLFHYRANGKVETLLYDGFRVVAKTVNGDGVPEFLSLVMEDKIWRLEATGRNYADVLDAARRLGGAPHPEDVAPAPARPAP